MYSLTVENQKGEKLELTHNTDYAIISIDGLTPAAATINSAVMGGFDGEKFSSSRVGKRNIVITIQIMRDAEKNRLRLYQFFRPKHPCRIYFKHSSRDVYIDGYVETFDGSLFELGQKMQISIICPQPYFLLSTKAAGDISRINSLFEFPFSIDAEGIPFSEINTEGSTNVVNNGDVETGLIIRMTATGKVVAPVLYNSDTRESFPLKNIVMTDGDVITINTNQGEKKIILTSKGMEVNILSKLTESVDWFQVIPGSNIFTFSCESGAEFLQIEFFLNEKFQGV